jgi:hypothetical protein
MPKDPIGIARKRARKAKRRGDVAEAERWLGIAVRATSLARSSGDDDAHAVAGAKARIPEADRRRELIAGDEKNFASTLRQGCLRLQPAWTGAGASGSRA